MAIWPLCASMSRFAVGKPRPDPRDFVVKNGVKIFSRMSAGMPGPLSMNAIWHVAIDGLDGDADRALATASRARR